MQQGDDAKDERRMHTSRNTFDDRAQKCRLEAQRGGEAFPIASDKSVGVLNLSPVWRKEPSRKQFDGESQGSRRKEQVEEAFGTFIFHFVSQGNTHKIIKKCCQVTELKFLNVPKK